MRTEVHDQGRDPPPRTQEARAGHGREETDQPWDEPRSTCRLVFAHAARSLAASQSKLRWSFCDAKMARRPIVAALATMLAPIASAGAGFAGDTSLAAHPNPGRLTSPASGPPTTRPA